MSAYYVGHRHSDGHSYVSIAFYLSRDLSITPDTADRLYGPNHGYVHACRSARVLFDMWWAGATHDMPKIVSLPRKLSINMGYVFNWGPIIWTSKNPITQWMDMLVERYLDEMVPNKICEENSGLKNLFRLSYIRMGSRAYDGYEEHFGFDGSTQTPLLRVERSIVIEQ